MPFPCMCTEISLFYIRVLKPIHGHVILMISSKPNQLSKVSFPNVITL